MDDLVEEVFVADGLGDGCGGWEGVNVGGVHLAEEVFHEALDLGVRFFADADFEVLGVVGEGFNQLLAESEGAVDGEEALGCVGVAVEPGTDDIED